MGCFGNKRVAVEDCITDGPVPAGVARKGTGRLEPDSAAKGDSSSRDGLHSAPTGQDGSKGLGGRAGLHSAPQRTPPNSKKGGATNDANSQASTAALGDFLVENAGDAAPDAAAVDAYLEDLLGPRIVKDLRHSDWAARVSGMEAVQQLVRKRATLSATTPTGQAESSATDGERAALFRGCITVLARVLQDKVVPVYLPALSLLSEVYSADFLEPMGASRLPSSAIPLFASQLVFRAGSSNQRAREESANALLNLARSSKVGCAPLAPWVLRPVSNTRSAHAVVGRLEVLRAYVGEFGLGSDSGLEMREVLAFTLPLCEAAAAAARDVAFGLALDVRAADPARVEALIDDLRPSVLPQLKARLAPPEAKVQTLGSLSVSGRKLPPIGTSFEGGDDVRAFNATPPGHEARARARQTASELGARSPPSASKKTKPPKAAASSDDVLSEATALVGDGSRSKVATGGSPSASGKLHFTPRDHPAEPQTEEQMMEGLMEEILEDTK